MLAPYGIKRESAWSWMPPPWLLDLVYLFYCLRSSGEITLHFKDGRLITHEDFRSTRNLR